jgi:hypothetical protein
VRIAVFLVWLTLVAMAESQAETLQHPETEGAGQQEAGARELSQIPSSEEKQVKPPGSAEAKPEAEQEPVDPCRPKDLDQNTWIDRLNRRLFVTVCSSAEWFDGFFGSDWASDEARGTHGTVSASVRWTEYEDFSFRFRGRVRVPLPNLERRMHAFVGRVDEDEFLSDTGEMVDSSRVVGGEDDTWMVGLGFTPIHRGNSRFTVSAGVNASLPAEPYVKGQYRWFHALPRDWLFRWRQTVFWRSEEGFGTTLGLDLEKRLSDRFLLRWSNANTLSQGTDGVEWWSSMTLYHLLSQRRAVGWTAWVSGETAAPVSLREYGLRVMLRNRLHREWLFGEVGTGIYWPRHEVADVRQASLGLWVGVALQFGEGPGSIPTGW